MTSRLLLTCTMVCASPVAAQEPSCDADPRWLVVTVVASRMSNDDGEMEYVREDGERVPFRDFSLGALMLDRCEGYYGFGSAGAEAFTGAQTTVSIRGGTTNTFYYVRESVHDICAAISDCADATR